MARKRLQAIHRNIATLRERSGLSQDALGKQCGVDGTAVWHWENGDSSPTGKRLPRVAAALGVTIDDLFRAEAKAS